MQILPMKKFRKLSFPNCFIGKICMDSFYSIHAMLLCHFRMVDIETDGFHQCLRIVRRYMETSYIILYCVSQTWNIGYDGGNSHARSFNYNISKSFTMGK